MLLFLRQRLHFFRESGIAGFSTASVPALQETANLVGTVLRRLMAATVRAHINGYYIGGEPELPAYVYVVYRRTHKKRACQTYTRLTFNPATPTASVKMAALMFVLITLGVVFSAKADYCQSTPYSTYPYW